MNGLVLRRQINKIGRSPFASRQQERPIGALETPMINSIMRYSD